MVKRILLPTDGSAFSQRAAEYALDLAAKYGARLTALHVIAASSPKQVSVESVDRDAAKRAETCFKPVKEKGEASGIEVETKILVARSVGPAILEEAEEGDYDLVVMGSHGLSGVKKFLLGSVSEAVVHHTTKPVLLVK